MPDRNRRFLLRERPEGRIGPNTFELSEEAVPEIGDGEALVRVDWISLDPTNRAWINATPTYLPPVGIGEVMRGGGLGEVIASKNRNYAVGQIVQGLVGWQEYAVTSDAMPLFPVDVAEGVSRPSSSRPQPVRSARSPASSPRPTAPASSGLRAVRKSARC
jgi:hypothetical protein